MKYRADVDGLRAYAVMPVLFYHVGYNWSPGGFVGVDIFFVISGFLITNLIVGQAREGRFSFANFYGRRVKRLFPAMFATVVLSAICAFLLFTPSDFESFGGSAVFTPVGLSNFFFWFEAGYWDSSKYVKPLLHTWSLGVEEQFYLIWPFLIVVLLAWSKRLILPVLVVMSAISLIAAEWYITHHPSAAFYLMPFRIAEFGIGAALVWLPRLKSMWAEIATLFIGLVLIFGSTVYINEDMRFPGLMAMLPCIGAAMAIYAGRAPGLTSVLSNPIAVWLGRISYSLYLVHWPIIVFWKYYILRPLTPKEQLMIIVISVILASASYLFIEQPFRKTKRLSMPAYSLSAAGLATMFVFLPLGTVWAKDGWAWRLADKAVLNMPRGGGDCAKIMCESSANAKEFVVYGDSFGRTYYQGMMRRYAREGNHFTIYWHDRDCRWFMPAANIKRGGADCEKRLQTFFDQIQDEKIDTLVIAYRWKTIGLHTDWKNRADFYGERFEAMMNRPEMESVKDVVLILAPPEFQHGYDSRQCMQAPKYLPGRDCETAPFKDFDKIRAINRRVLDSFRRHLPQGVTLHVENPFKWLCKEDKFCRQVVNGNPVYWDIDHFTDYASRYLVFKWTWLEDKYSKKE